MQTTANEYKSASQLRRHERRCAEALSEAATNISQTEEKAAKASKTSQQCVGGEKATERKVKEAKHNYNCDECQIDCTSMGEFEVHLIDEHDNDTEVEYFEVKAAITGEVHLQCKDCSERKLARTALLAHIK